MELYEIIPKEYSYTLHYNTHRPDDLEEYIKSTGIDLDPREKELCIKNNSLYELGVWDTEWNNHWFFYAASMERLLELVEKELL